MGGRFEQKLTKGTKMSLFESPFSRLSPVESPFLAANFVFQVQGLFSWIDSFAHWTSRKNCCGPVMGLVTVFWPAMTTTGGEFEFQADGEARFVVSIMEVIWLMRLRRAE